MEKRTSFPRALIDTSWESSFFVTLLAEVKRSGSTGSFSRKAVRDNCTGAFWMWTQ